MRGADEDVLRMQPYPHTYAVSAAASVGGVVTVRSPELPDLETAPPREFDGPGDKWSPETLLCAAVADCFILTFRALARASHLEWVDLQCNVTAILERAEGRSRFTRFDVSASLWIAPGIDEHKAHTLLERAEHLCLVSNSLNGVRALHAEVLVTGSPPGHSRL